MGVEVGARLFHGVVEIIFSERWSMCLVGVDTGVEVEPTASGDGVDEPALLNRSWPRIEDDGDGS